MNISVDTKKQHALLLLVVFCMASIVHAKSVHMDMDRARQITNLIDIEKYGLIIVQKLCPHLFEADQRNWTLNADQNISEMCLGTLKSLLQMVDNLTIPPHHTEKRGFFQLQVAKNKKEVSKIECSSRGFKYG